MDNFSIGYANIALVKYWGKKSKNPVLPFNPNISLRLDSLYSKTKIEKSSSGYDEFYINDKKQSDKEVSKIINFIDKFVPSKRERIKIISYNTVPTAAGLSSSSSGTMALVIACNEYFKLNKSTEQLIKIAKEGSGSSCRSFFKMASWLEDGTVKEIKCNLDLAMFILVVSEDIKEISSREAMERCVKTSTNFKEWTETAKKDFDSMISAIEENNFTKIGKITESNALAMHSTTKCATPSFSFLTEESYEAMDIVKKIRNSGIECYFTMDAGPNVKVLYQKKDHDKLYEEIKYLWKKKIIQCMV
ncbi:diphosphomevalonate decarboxylase [Gemella sp. GH3]|uniref:diphosphomevalonate decarboxylase n=1 Tax=unclassified Gemella TaxID=2624949 RepID=UPI0015D0A983|nr:MULTISPECIES: diphosphomevalonate decarboxylase [unclassified Gemella]MBF0714226.1 diphosphomevalonate decarboxylase [Gemella sp. GH3.1]NYS51178.1 diphosphomevalonate decarboxylase [Gemella sp. GH3]